MLVQVYKMMKCKFQFHNSKFFELTAQYKKNPQSLCSPLSVVINVPDGCHGCNVLCTRGFVYIQICLPWNRRWEEKNGGAPFKVIVAITEQNGRAPGAAKCPPNALCLWKLSEKGQSPLLKIPPLVHPCWWIRHLINSKEKNTSEYMHITAKATQPTHSVCE